MAPPTPPPATLLRMVVISSEPPPVAALPIMLWRIVPPKPPPDNSGDGIPHGSQTIFFHGCTRHVAPNCTADCLNNEADDVHRFGFLHCPRCVAVTGLQTSHGENGSPQPSLPTSDLRSYVHFSLENQASSSGGTLPPFSASFLSTSLCSQMFIEAESFWLPL